MNAPYNYHDQQQAHPGAPRPVPANNTNMPHNYNSQQQAQPRVPIPVPTSNMNMRLNINRQPQAQVGVQRPIIANNMNMGYNINYQQQVQPGAQTPVLSNNLNMGYNIIYQQQAPTQAATGGPRPDPRPVNTCHTEIAQLRFRIESLEHFKNVHSAHLGSRVAKLEQSLRNAHPKIEHLAKTSNTVTAYLDTQIDQDDDDEDEPPPYFLRRSRHFQI